MYASVAYNTRARFTANPIGTTGTTVTTCTADRTPDLEN